MIIHIKEQHIPAVFYLFATLIVIILKPIIHKSSWRHDTGSHPENKARLNAFQNLPETIIQPNEDLVRLIHPPSYLEEVKRACSTGHSTDADTVLCSHSYEAAVCAATLTVEAIGQEAMALVRPPGHHAFPTRTKGFCIFNNVAIAAEYLIRQKFRVLVLDFDGHLGDGTSAIFSERDDVLYWSFHQFPAYPGHGNWEETGRGKGKNHTINVPMPPGSGDDVFKYAWEGLWPLVDQYQPDYIAISAGFDGHRFDPLLQLNYSTGLFYWIGQQLYACRSKIFATLEGGYNLDFLPHCINNFIAGVNNEPPAHIESPTESSMQTWQEFEFHLPILQHHLRDTWKF